MSKSTCKEAMVLEALVGFLITQIVSGLYEKITNKLKRAAIENTSNQFILTYFAQHDSDPQVRSEASKKLISPTTLRKLLRKEKVQSVRLAILSKLSGAEVVDEYLKAKDRATKRSLLNLIVTQHELCRVANNETNLSLLKLILPQVTDPECIRGLQKHTLLEVRNWADSQLWGTKTKEKQRDPVLAILAEESPDRTLLMRVRLPMNWLKIALLHQNPQVKSFAILNLANRKDLLARLATNKDLEITSRMQALRMLGPNQLIATLAQSDPILEIRVQAVSMLDPQADSTALTSIMKHEKKTDVLIQAIMTTTSMDDLKLLEERLDPQKSPHILAILQRRRQILAKKP